MLTSIPDDLFNKVSIEDLERQIQDYALSNGICLRRKTDQANDTCEICPLTIFPSPFPRTCFETARNVQTSVNELMHRVATDYDFLSNTLSRTIEVDEFTKDLFDVYNRVRKDGLAQPNFLGLFRADYMADRASDDQFRLRQIEVNAIASSFVGLSCKVSKMHHMVVSQFCSPEVARHHVPVNRADQNFVQSFIKAWECYGTPSAVILVVTEDRTINICDQRALEFILNELRPDIRIIRRSFQQLLERASFKDNQLMFVDNMEVALVYYRMGYDPSHLATRELWDLRYKIERSRAIKCPSINYHLAGVKKIQQQLSSRKELERFLSPEVSKRMAATFAGLWGFELNDEGDRAVELALSEPERFVMKPQREGGGNNIYGLDIVNELRPIKDDKRREAYILMEMIKPPVVSNLLLGPGIGLDRACPQQKMVSELGIYGAIFGNQQEIIFNNESGHVLRSKKFGVNEGGVAAGFASVDSPYLI